MGTYGGFVAAAYAITVVAVAALIAWVVLERFAARKALARAERRLRRPAGPGGTAQPPAHQSAHEHPAHQSQPRRTP